MKKQVSLWVTVLACLVCIVLTAGGLAWGLYKLTGNNFGGLKFLRALSLVEAHYEGQYDKDKLFEGAISGMVKTLDDPYSVYLDKEAFASLNDTTEGSFGGVGIVLGKKDKEFVVVAPLEGTPGAKAGIKAGEKTRKIDGKDVAGLQLEEVVGKIRGENGTKVELTLEAKDGSIRNVTVVRGEIKIESVVGKMLPGTKIGYIRLAVFNDNTGADFLKAYQKLEGEGMQATVLDLRQNPGGLLNEAVKVARVLVPKGPIVSVTDKQGRTVTQESQLPALKYPLAVLVDHGSASASEIVAGAIQDTHAGKLFGVTTFGKGVVQTIYRMGNATGLKLTTANYYTPSGRSINKVGIKPDEVVELNEQTKDDEQLKAAEAYLKQELQSKQ